MLVKEFLSNKPDYKNVTFIKARARKDANTPFYHPEYQETPIRPACEWKGDICDYIMLNDAQAPIDWLSGCNWKKAFDRGELISLLVISAEDFELLFPDKEQRDDLIKSIDSQIAKNK